MRTWPRINELACEKEIPDNRSGLSTWHSDQYQCRHSSFETPKEHKQYNTFAFVACADPEDGGTDPPPPNMGKSQAIGFHINTGPNPMEKCKATQPAFIVGPSSLRWWADDDPF